MKEYADPHLTKLCRFVLDDISDPYEAAFLQLTDPHPELSVAENALWAGVCA